MSAEDRRHRRDTERKSRLCNQSLRLIKQDSEGAQEVLDGKKSLHAAKVDADSNSDPQGLHGIPWSKGGKSICGFILAANGTKEVEVHDL